MEFSYALVLTICVYISLACLFARVFCTNLTPKQWKKCLGISWYFGKRGLKPLSTTNKNDKHWNTLHLFFSPFITLGHYSHSQSPTAQAPDGTNNQSHRSQNQLFVSEFHKVSTRIGGSHSCVWELYTVFAKFGMFTKLLQKFKEFITFLNFTEVFARFCEFTTLLESLQQSLEHIDFNKKFRLTQLTKVQQFFLQNLCVIQCLQKFETVLTFTT